MSKEPLGAGIIGAGVIFQDHARAYSQLAPRTRLIGLADIDVTRARAAASDFFVPVVTDDYQELLARDDIDIVSVCTPPSLHEQVVIDALKAGKYVLCEKPLAHNLASADRIIDAAREFPHHLSVVYQLRYTPDVLRTQWLVEEGHLGQLQFGRFSRVNHIPQQHRTGGSWWGKWSVAGGGALMTQCIHEVDIQLLLFGPPRRVTASMATIASPIESEDTISAMVEHESGAMVSIACSLGHYVGMRSQSDIMGRDVAVHFPWAINTTDRGRRTHLQREAVKRFPGSEPRKLLPGKLDKVYRVGMRKLGLVKKREIPSAHTPYVAAVLDAICAGTDLPISPEDARRSLELCVAIYTSALSGQPVELPLSSDCPYYEGISTADYNGGICQRKLQEVQT